jgi:hypothetical protein
MRIAIRVVSATGYAAPKKLCDKTFNRIMLLWRLAKPRTDDVVGHIRDRGFSSASVLSSAQRSVDAGRFDYYAEQL